jgi:hypothetical protein
MKTPSLHTAAMLVTLATTLAAYDHWIVRPALRLGLVDVAEVYREKEAEFTAILTRASTDAERERAMALARRFAERLPAALGELSQDCGCLVVLRSTVAAPTPRTVDLTDLLRHKLGSAR